MPTPRLPFDERGGLVILVDPGRASATDVFALAERCVECGVCGFLIGDSLGRGGDVAAHISALRAGAPGLPIVQFPASADDLSAHVDAVLYLVLLSGRNPRYLIEEQLRAVPFFDRNPNVAAVSTAYLLIDGGRESAVEHVTGTDPLPADDVDTIAAHVRAGQLMGLHATYLEAGSGAAQPVQQRVIEAARAATRGPLLVGGGISTPNAARAARDAGADYVVIGTLFEQRPAASIEALAVAARA
ncbi:MAG TPA: geranylgeranylglyceryl/heptaprenylglyceryl phosphate synthase [Gemmatimonadaceae bacterium]|nr:geranylgeranylglyceryl/heptaprenylglyceryl phosphate synthase [Gemmatimonadaceae bacterium]